MRKVIVSNVALLDGFFEGPHEELDWFVPDEEFLDYARDMLRAVDTLLFGRATYQYMANYWPSAPADEIEDKMNHLPKMVFPKTLQTVEWNNSRLVKGNAAEEVSKLKHLPGKDMVVLGSATLASSLLQLGLVDEYRIILPPVLLGSGNPLFKDIKAKNSPETHNSQGLWLRRSSTQVPESLEKQTPEEVMSKVRVLVGTRKGAFVLTSDGKREKWEVSGPHFAGWEMYHVKGSPADPNRLYASQSSGWFGQIIQRSDDGGKTWHQPGTPPGESPAPGPPRAESNKFVYDTSDESGKPLTTHQWYDGTQHPWEFKRVWHLEPSLTDPDTVYAGVEDAALFRSTDGGQNWKELSGLRGHGTGPKWQPGAGGMCLHTIILDPGNPQRIYIAISAAGAFRTDDGGKTWKPINHGLHSQYIPDPHAEVGHCVHHVAMNPSRPGVLFMQKHWDVMRSNDAGDSWQEISGNLPTDFGFVIDVHAHEPETIYVVPIKSDSEHFVPDGKLRVYRSRTGGNEWEALTNGLPQSNCYVNVLRDAMAVDSLDKCGVYFGTSGGQVYASADAGDSWAPIVRDLPAVLSVEVQTLS